MDNENTTPTEEKDKKPEQAEESKPEAETATETSSEAPEEQTEETTPPTAETAPEAEPEQPEETPEAAPEEGETLEAKVERLEAENAALKAREEARKAGFKNEYVEDAVIIAEYGAKRDGTTITEALQAVAKKFPEWKQTADDKGKGGFKAGAGEPKENTAAEDASLDEAFGIRRKK
jgi:hypothetical protein